MRRSGSPWGARCCRGWGSWRPGHPSLAKGCCKSRSAARCRTSSSPALAGLLQDVLLVQLGELSQPLLQLLPGGDALARGSLRRLGDVVAGGLAFLATVAHIEMRAVLGSRPSAVAARVTAGAIGLGERPEDRDLRQTLDLENKLLSPFILLHQHGPFVAPGCEP